jgi:hypothetical protein
MWKESSRKIYGTPIPTGSQRAKMVSSLSLHMISNLREEIIKGRNHHQHVIKYNTMRS